jgi:hypothetical protein
VILAVVVVVAAGSNDSATADAVPAVALTVSWMDPDHLNDPLFVENVCLESNKLNCQHTHK